MAEEREARGTRHRGATAVRAEITPVRGASQHQMVSRRDPYLHLQRGRRVNAGEQRHSRQVTCVFSDIFYIRNSARTAFFSDRDRAGGEALRDSPLFSSFLLFERARRFWLRFIAFFSVRGGVKGVNFEGGGIVGNGKLSEVELRCVERCVCLLRVAFLACFFLFLLV